MTLPTLQAALAAGRITPVAGVVFGVTDDLRSEYPGADDEELEYLAMTDAARASLRLVAGDQAAWLRVVAAADVPHVMPAPQRDRAVAEVSGPVPWSQVSSIHLDGADAADDVMAAALVVDAADLGDEDAEFVIGTVQDRALAWYAPDEIRFLLEDIGEPTVN